jgi:hypothetical protein
MRQATGAGLSALLFVSASAPAAGQVAPAECPLCRAVAGFTTCTKPLEGHRPFTAKVVGVEKAACSQVLSLDVVRAQDQSLPARIKVDLGPCAYWAGKPDDQIEVAVRPHATGNNVYSLACTLF